MATEPSPEVRELFKRLDMSIKEQAKLLEELRQLADDEAQMDYLRRYAKWGQGKGPIRRFLGL